MRRWYGHSASPRCHRRSHLNTDGPSRRSKSHSSEATSSPTLDGTENMPGAISLNSAAINGSRVIGPALASQLFPYLGAAWLFVINAATFVFIIVSLFTVRLPTVVRSGEAEQRKSLATGYR